MSTIAIVGMACLYPDARSPGELWENVLARRRAFRRIPSERLNLADYYDPDPSTPDAIYAQEAAVLEGWEFDRVRFRVAGSTYRSADLTHWLALDVAERALRNAGFPDAVGLPRERTGVLLGNTLTGEFSRAELLRLRWPFVRRMVAAQLRQHGWEAAELGEFIEELERSYKAPFAPVTEETLAGGLSNTIAGRICNHFHLQGGGYTLDGACSSSLLAVANACTALVQGDLDAALAGGVDLSLDPFELVGFSKTGALAKGTMRVYDRDSSGFLPGEGCGFVVLMREDDALARGLRSYALIRGWGISSDGAGGLTRPEVEGQRFALERAYARAGYGINSVALFEGHGTGTVVGDEVELATLGEARAAADPQAQPAVIGSVKANIGHTKAAAGVAGLIKATMALHSQVLPPMTGTQRPHDRICAERPALRLLRQAELWPEKEPLRAGVSSFGFGGINVHIALEGATASRRSRLTPQEMKLRSSPQDAELFLFAAEGPAALRDQLQHLAALAPRLSHAELADLAAELATELAPAHGSMRAALVAATPSELARNLDTLLAWLERGETRRLEAEAFLWEGDTPPRIALLFPGQASPVRFDGGAMGERFPEIAELYRNAALEVGDPLSTEVAQPAIVAAELAGLRLLQKLGLHADLALGHSLGELTALHWAGALDEPGLLRLARARGQAMAQSPGPAGAMAGIGAKAAVVAALLRPGTVIAGLNSAQQTVVSGEEQALLRVMEEAARAGLRATRLPVSHAFHSPLMQPAAVALAGPLAETDFAPCRRRVISSVTGEPVGEEENLRLLLERQLTSPVLFTQALEHVLDEADLCLEVGPGSVLSGVLSGLLPAAVPVYPLDTAGASLRGLLAAAGAAHALGARLDTRGLFGDRFTRPFSLERPLNFLANPCEQAPQYEEGVAAHRAARPVLSSPPSESPAPHSATIAAEGPQGEGQNFLALVRAAVAQRAELPLEAISDDSRLLRDLHLNSISVGQLVAEVAKRAGLPAPAAPTDYAAATVAGVAESLEELRRTGGDRHAPDAFPAGVDTWVRAFAASLLEAPLPSGGSAPPPGIWRALAPAGHASAEPIRQALEAWGGGGVLVCLDGSEEDEGEDVRLLLEGAKLALEHDGEPRYFVLLQQGRPASGFAKTLYLEASELAVCVLDLPPGLLAPERVVAEVRAASGYSEAHYDAAGLRREPRLEVLDLREDAGPPLGPGDVLLVSGGGRGIAAECAAMLALDTGASLALLGRSRPEQDSELAENLERLTAKGIIYRYLSVDVADAEAVRAAVARAEAELGPVTALLHGAGINVPRLLGELGEDAVRRTLTPKVDGLRHLLAAVAPERLRLLLTFSSVIARTGMRGEADYALANEWLSWMTEAFRTRHPQCRCLALEWSLWSGVGMGERLGRVDALLREGITPITPDLGLGMLRRLVWSGLPVAGVVVSGRLGSAPTVKFAGPALPLLRFLERPRLYYPGVELVAEAELAEVTDPYLNDHAFQGERLFPTVMGMEAMVQAAQALLGRADVPAIENLKLLRPVVVAGGGSTRLRICALARGREGANDGANDVVELALRCETTGFEADHFRALCRFGPLPPSDSQTIPKSVLDLDPGRDLYGGLLFHKGRFQRLQGYRELSAVRCCAEIGAGDGSPWFGRYLPDTLLLGDPGSRDAALHAIQACIPHEIVLPTGLAKWLPGRLDLPAPWFVQAQERWHDGDDFCYDLTLCDAQGQIRERWEGLTLRRVEAEMPKRDAWPLALLVPYLERRLAELLPGPAPVLSLSSQKAGERRERSDLALRAILGEDAKILRRPDGKPEVPGGGMVSTSHADDLTLAMAAAGGVAGIACDLEAVAERPEGAWADLLGAQRMALARLIAQEAGEAFAAAATRVWAAAECLAKAGLPPTAPLTLETVQADGWVLLKSGGVAVAAWLVKLEGRPAAYGLAVLAELAAEPITHEPIAME
ncbi:MAG: type I polyketide synthase [Pseudomonadota bacterium]|nr:type I polyketide synthase [Pseudomonadota bacterium]